MVDGSFLHVGLKSYAFAKHIRYYSQKRRVSTRRTQANLGGYLFKINQSPIYTHAGLMPIAIGNAFVKYALLLAKAVSRIVIGINPPVHMCLT